ncbi:uncharacterized protein [Typha angustifolia]|uniref:uncharacterized protein n=1 Tax=Typha angustifolia TaxID=59011 RepID=UPI003C2DCDCA
MVLQILNLSVPIGKVSQRCHSFISSSSGCRVSLRFNTRSEVNRLGCLYRDVLFHKIEVLGRAYFYNLNKPNRRSLGCSATLDNYRTEVVESDQLVELPLLPLPLVFFPGRTISLQIFEFRYRIMMQTLLQRELRFGIIYTDKAGRIADVGCVGEVVKYESLVDDRFFLICKGQERFRVVHVVRRMPYLVAQVKCFKDLPSISEQHDLEPLALEVENYMEDVRRLSNKLNEKRENETKDLRRDLLPIPFSFFIASTFEDSPKEQQALLEMEDTAMLLNREKETLRNKLNYLAAACAIKDAFQYSSFNEN